MSCHVDPASSERSVEADEEETDDSHCLDVETGSKYSARADPGAPPGRERAANVDPPSLLASAPTLVMTYNRSGFAASTAGVRTDASAMVPAALHVAPSSSLRSTRPLSHSIA